MENLYMVYITAPNKEEALKIGESVVGQRLAACANITDKMTSIYWWEGSVRKENEAVLVLKTKESLLPDLEKAVKELHSYECPCIAAIPLTHVSEDYAKWIISSVKKV